METNRILQPASNYAAYIPCYSGGNSVMAIEKDGHTVIINKGIKSLIKNLLREYSIDMEAFKRNFSDSIGRKNLFPIPLGLHMILIPVKVRKTIGVNDGSYGYIDLSCIENVEGIKNASITLTCKTHIQTLESKKTIESRIRMGNSISQMFAAKIMRADALKEGQFLLSQEYGKNATKEDIALLTYEIMKLMNIIEKLQDKTIP